MSLGLLDIAVIQMSSTPDAEENLSKLHTFLRQVSSSKAKVCFLPECFYALSDGQKPTPFLVEFGNEGFEKIRSLAQKYNLFLIGGSVAFKEKGKIFNRTLNFDPQGNSLDSYDKMNLFRCNLSEKESLNEGNIYSRGGHLAPIKVHSWKIGQSICFDLRYPQIYQNYRLMGAHLLSCCAAFTVPTGKAHWETLLRARAIENQSFVVASAQYGKNNEKISTYGHSLVIDPWGNILANALEGEKVIYAQLNSELIDEARAKIFM